MFTVTSEIQNRFFDRQAVIESIGRANARRLGRMGAFIRTRAQKDILRRGSTGRGRNRIRRSAARGQPPFVHSRDSIRTLRNIQFGMQSDDAGVVIGPLKLHQKNRFTETSLTVPQLLEFGGNARLREYRYRIRDNDTWLPGSPRRKRDRDEVETRTRRAHYSPHPFMGPALEKEIAAGTVANVWSAGY